MMEHDYRHLSTVFDMDAWLDAVDDLAPGNHSARTFAANMPFVHTTGPSGEIIIRQWPEGTTPAAIEARATVLDAISKATDGIVPTIEPVPGTDGQRTVQVKERLYSRLPYRQGTPLGRYGGYKTPDGRPINLPLPESAAAHDTVATVARLIAQAHEASVAVMDEVTLPAMTLQMFLDETRKVWFEQRRVIGDRAAEQRDIRRWLRCGNRVIPTASDLIRNEPELLTEKSVAIHNDLWSVNVLVDGRDKDRAVTGIVGWSHMAAGSPVLDIAALAVHMQGWSAAMTETVVESYAVERGLRPDQRRIIPAVASLNLVVIVANLLTLSYLDDRMINHEALPVLRSGMKTMLNSLERLTHILAPDIEQTERFARQRDGQMRKIYDRSPGYVRPADKPRRPRRKSDNR